MRCNVEAPYLMATADFVFFDLDDTLLDHKRAERFALSGMYRGLALTDELPLEQFLSTYHDVNVEVWRAYGAGELSKAEARSVRFERLFGQLGIDGHNASALGEEYLGRYGGFWNWLPGAREAWHAVADLLPVGLITNGFAEVQRRKLERFSDLPARASTIVISEEAGVMKPDRRIFDLAAERAACPSHRILYVGDSLHSDVEGALAAGWQAAWFRGQAAQAPEGVLVFDDWSRLIARLGQSPSR